MPDFTLEHNIPQVRARLARACDAAGRPVESVTLLAVSKTQEAARVRRAHAAGLGQFGENYVQEGLAKIAALADLRGQLTWHFIGPLQSNKTRAVAEAFDWVHTVERLKVAERLSAQRPPGLPPLQVCVQVNVDGEATKSGVAPDEAPALCRAVAALPRLALRGLMAIPAPAPTPARAPHRALRGLFEAIRADLGAPAGFDTLSMGMSADLEAAILEGSTLVRVGTALFGPRA